MRRRADAGVTMRRASHEGWSVSCLGSAAARSPSRLAPPGLDPYLGRAVETRHRLQPVEHGSSASDTSFLVHREARPALLDQQARWLGLCAPERRVQTPPSEDRDDHDLARAACPRVGFGDGCTRTFYSGLARPCARRRPRGAPRPPAARGVQNHGGVLRGTDCEGRGSDGCGRSPSADQSRHGEAEEARRVGLRNPPPGLSPYHHHLP